MVESQAHAVIDNGTGYMKAGFSGEEAPKAVFPTLVGIPKEGAMLGSETKDRLIGQEALEKLAIQDINYPIKRGEIVDWSDMEKIWAHSFFNELRIEPEQHVVLLTDPPLTKEVNRENMTEKMFENFGVPGLFISSQSVLAMYATGKTSGLVVDSGEGMTYFVPVYEGYEFKNSINKIPRGGKDLTDYLIFLLNEKSYQIHSKDRQMLVNDIKEKNCYVCLNYDQEYKEANQRSDRNCKYVMPDGEEIQLDYERFKCPEAMFQFEFFRGKDENLSIDENDKGIHDICYNTINNSDNDIKGELYSNIVLAGGNTMFQGFAERLKTEVKQLIPNSATSAKVKIIANPERRYASWIGGSILSSLSNFQYMWVTKREFDEVGKYIIHKKCF